MNKKERKNKNSFVNSKSNKQFLTSKSGITLIALILTIIILLILAMVSISYIMRENIIKHAETAVDQYQIEAEKEAIELAYEEYVMDGLNDKNAKLNMDGQAEVTENKDADGNNNGWTVTFPNLHVYYVDSNGNISEKNNNNPEGNEPSDNPEEETPAKYFTWETTETEATVTGLTDEGKALSEISIPSTYNGKPVTRIGEYAFEIKNSIITKVTIPNSIKIIGMGAFNSCKITEIIIPNGVTTIDYSAFAFCDLLKNVEISESVTTINDGAFGSCSSLEEIYLPENITFVGNGTFTGCDKLTIYVNKTKEETSSWAFDWNSGRKVVYKGDEEISNSAG